MIETFVGETNAAPHAGLVQRSTLAEAAPAVHDRANQRNAPCRPHTERGPDAQATLTQYRIASAATLKLKVRR